MTSDARKSKRFEDVAQTLLAVMAEAAPFVTILPAFEAIHPPGNAFSGGSHRENSLRWAGSFTGRLRAFENLFTICLATVVCVSTFIRGVLSETFTSDSRTRRSFKNVVLGSDLITLTDDQLTERDDGGFHANVHFVSKQGLPCAVKEQMLRPNSTLGNLRALKQIQNFAESCLQLKSFSGQTMMRSCSEARGASQLSLSHSQCSGFQRSGLPLVFFSSWNSISSLICTPPCVAPSQPAGTLLNSTVVQTYENLADANF